MMYTESVLTCSSKTAKVHGSTPTCRLDESIAVKMDHHTNAQIVLFRDLHFFVLNVVSINVF